MLYAPCPVVRLSKKALFAPKKSVIGPKLDLFSTIFLILSTSYLGPTTDLCYDLEILQLKAQAGKRGLWQDDSPVPPWEFRRQTKR